ncbi:MAG: hypothetical protein LBI57_03210 [Helicobacteraceae bacterium]|jgi:hypothetical protein|nr:hypothetical protein [Helicobacteraceae bacterium]
MAEDKFDVIKAIEAADNRVAADRRAFAIRIALSIVVLALLIASRWGAAREQSFEALFAPLDKQAEEYLERTLTKTAFTYAGVRATHAIVSMFKGTQLHPPFVTLSVGEALSPVLDVIEKLSDALALAIVSLGAQRILMEVGSQIGLSIFVSVGAIILLFAIWIVKFQKPLAYWGARLLALGLVVRLIIPLTAFGASMIAERFLQAKYEESIADMEFQRSSLGENILPGEETGFMEKIKNWASMEALSTKVDAFKERANALVKSFITLFSLFVFETIIFPIISLWLLTRLFFAFTPRKD